MHARTPKTMSHPRRKRSEDANAGQPQNFATGCVHSALDSFLGKAVTECTCSICVHIVFNTRGNRAIIYASMLAQCMAWLLDAGETIHTWRGRASRRVWARVFTHSRVNAAMYIAEIGVNEATNVRTPASLAASATLKERAPEPARAAGRKLAKAAASRTRRAGLEDLQLHGSPAYGARDLRDAPRPDPRMPLASPRLFLATSPRVASRRESVAPRSRRQSRHGLDDRHRR